MLMNSVSPLEILIRFFNYEVLGGATKWFEKVWDVV